MEIGNHMIQVFLLQTVLEAADKAITALRLARSGSSSATRKRKVKDEVSCSIRRGQRLQFGSIVLYASHIVIK